MDKILRHIPVIIMSALDDMKSIIHCIEIGAEDYLPKSFNPVLLKARVRACIEKKRLRDKEQRYVRALMESQKKLEEELREAAQYVRTLLPCPMDSPVRSRWTFLPSAQLGGDSFGYHWLDEDTRAMSGDGAVSDTAERAPHSARGFNASNSAEVPNPIHDPSECPSKA
jgi:sigma-B regulation protein RsbU (phosphoserine phosphatase)